jgi:hypothetical protein
LHVPEVDGDPKICLRDCQAVVEENGEKEWWVEVRMSSGKIGWTKAEYNFNGIDALASTSF